MKPAKDYGWLVADVLEEAARDGLDPVGAVTKAMAGAGLQIGDATRLFIQQAPRIPDEAQRSKVDRLCRGVLGASRWLADAEAMAVARDAGRRKH